MRNLRVRKGSVVRVNAHGKTQRTIGGGSIQQVGTPGAASNFAADSRIDTNLDKLRKELKVLSVASGHKPGSTRKKRYIQL